ncbi:MAG: PEP-CTERM sorting domain-containing protein [Verrucomicrobiaceae bacterium]|nr:MAG: PEP-CTERM sorting domain-containing protein [Verrucomicrobiaceae bacterium]
MEYGRDTILIDFNTQNGSGGPGGTWNVFAAPEDINGGFLMDSFGVQTPFRLNVAGTITDSANFGAAGIFDNTNPNSLPAWATSSSNNGASGDYFYTSTSPGADTFILTISGLTPGDQFSLDLLASRNDMALPGGLYEYSLDGTAWFGFSVLNSDGTPATTDDWDTKNTKTQAFNIETQGYNLHRYMNVSDVTLTGSSLQIRVTDSNLEDATITNSYTVLNAVQLTVEPVPEPSTMGLLGLGVGALLLRRRARMS